MGTALKHLLKLVLGVATGLLATGFAAHVLNDIIPEWIGLGHFIGLVGVLATLVAAILYIFHTLRHRHETFRWNFSLLLSPLVASAIVSAISFGGNFLASAFLAGLPPSTGMSGGDIAPTELPVLHYGAPLAGMLLGGFYLLWSWRRSRPRNEDQASVRGTSDAQTKKA